MTTMMTLTIRSMMMTMVRIVAILATFTLTVDSTDDDDDEDAVATGNQAPGGNQAAASSDDDGKS